MALPVFAVSACTAWARKVKVRWLATLLASMLILKIFSLFCFFLVLFCFLIGMTGDYLGGEAYWAGGVHLYTPLPFRPGRGGFGDLFRTHFFLNAGNLCNLNYGGLAPKKQTLKKKTEGEHPRAWNLTLISRSKC